MKTRVLILTGLALSLGLAILFAPFASGDPDGLEKVAEDLKFLETAEAQPPAWDAAPLPDYETPGVAQWMSTSISGILGTLAAFGVACGAARLLKKREEQKPATEQQGESGP